MIAQRHPIQGKDSYVGGLAIGILHPRLVKLRLSGGKRLYDLFRGSGLPFGILDRIPASKPNRKDHGQDAKNSSQSLHADTRPPAHRFRLQGWRIVSPRMDTVRYRLAG